MRSGQPNRSHASAGPGSLGFDQAKQCALRAKLRRIGLGNAGQPKRRRTCGGGNAKGLRVSELSRDLHRSPSDIQAHLKRLDKEDRVPEPEHVVESVPDRAQSAWTAEEDERLESAHQLGRTLSELATAHQREISEVIGRLVHLGVIRQG